VDQHQPFFPFGCKASAYLYEEQRNKNQDKVEENMVMIGYAAKRGYLLLRENGRVVVRHQVTFYPDEFPYQKKAAAAESTAKDEEEENSSTKKKKKTAPPPRARSKRVTFKPSTFMNNSYNVADYKAVGMYAMMTDTAQAEAVMTISSHPKEPKTFSEATSRDNPYRKEWLKAIQEELESHKVNGTWSRKQKPAGRRTIGCKWVFKLKLDADGEVARFKARLVAQGFSQVYGIDYKATFAPTVRFATIRLFFAIVAAESWAMLQLDVKTAYLIPTLDETIYMRVPPGVKGDFGEAMLLNKSLYGLKQAGRKWNQNLHDTFIKKGLTQSKHDPCLYLKFENGELVGMVVVYVDDILAGGLPRVVTDISNALTSTYKMTKSPVEHFLGMRVSRNREGTITLTQDAYARRLAERFGLKDAKERNTPGTDRLLKSDCPDNFEERQKMEKVPYREAVGGLMYLAVVSRPDIQYAVNQASRFLENPGQAHWAAVKTIIRYVNSTANEGLQFEANAKRKEAPVVQGWSDSDWAGDQEDRRSTSGYVFKVFGGTVSWKSKKQETVALSSCEAEIMALTMSMKEALWLRSILLELQLVECDDKGTPLPMTIFEDNQGAKALADDAKFSDRTKHIDLRYMRVREEVKRKYITIEYCSTKKMIADIFTKPLNFKIFKEVKALCMN
jgi:hypothetical protein